MYSENKTYTNAIPKTYTNNNVILLPNSNRKLDLESNVLDEYNQPLIIDPECS